LALMIGISAPALGQSVSPEVAAGASVVFVGTVQQAEGSTFTDLPLQPGMMVVRTDEVVRKPDSIGLASGDLVTVIAEPGSPMAAQERGRFYTEIVLVGETLSVRELARESMGVQMAAAEEADVTFEMADPALRAEVNEAEVIVVGRVSAVREPVEASLSPEQQPITEHDPQWREAVVEVQRSIKGSEPGEVLVVRFPASIDVAWYRAPKLQVGTEGTFILDADVISGGPARSEVAGVEERAFTALEPQSVAPAAAADAIEALIQP
jgi:hypothetical protein